VNTNTLKQPKALSICFLTEMWERFGYILIQTLLIFVLLQEFGFSTANAGKLVGTFTGIIFVTSVVAGYISDFFLGYLRSVIIGSILLFIGYLCISIVKDYALLCLGLSVICIGTGLLKTNVSGFLGLFYEAEDPRRNIGFTIFYIGINVGPILGAIVSTAVQQYFHVSRIQHVLFLAAFAVLLAGLVFYIGYKIHKYPLAKEKLSRSHILLAMVIIILSIAVAMWILYSPTVSTLFFILISIGCLVSLIMVSLRTRQQIWQTITYILFLLIAILYYALYNQIFISINIFNEFAVNKSVLGLHFSPQAFVSVDNLGVIIFGILVIKFFGKMSNTAKFILASFSLCGVFLLLLCSVLFTPTASNIQVSPWWVIAAYFVLAFSEVFIAPLGLALATKFAPEGRNGLFIGAWLVIIGVAGELAGVLSKHVGLPAAGASLPVIKSIYNGVFIKFLSISIGAFIVTLLLAWLIRVVIKNTATATISHH